MSKSPEQRLWAEAKVKLLEAEVFLENKPLLQIKKASF
jgi:hypothetical protein